MPLDIVCPTLWSRAFPLGEHLLLSVARDPQVPNHRDSLSVVPVLWPMRTPETLKDTGPCSHLPFRAPLSLCLRGQNLLWSLELI